MTFTLTHEFCINFLILADVILGLITIKFLYDILTNAPEVGGMIEQIALLNNKDLADIDYKDYLSILDILTCKDYYIIYTKTLCFLKNGIRLKDEVIQAFLEENQKEIQRLRDEVLDIHLWTLEKAKEELFSKETIKDYWYDQNLYKDFSKKVRKLEKIQKKYERQQRLIGNLRRL